MTRPKHIMNVPQHPYYLYRGATPVGLEKTLVTGRVLAVTASNAGPSQVTAGLAAAFTVQINQGFGSNLVTTVEFRSGANRTGTLYATATTYTGRVDESIFAQASSQTFDDVTPPGVPLPVYVYAIYASGASDLTNFTIAVV